jgi:hypothetical protein
MDAFSMDALTIITTGTSIIAQFDPGRIQRSLASLVVWVVVVIGVFALGVAVIRQLLSDRKEPGAIITELILIIILIGVGVNADPIIRWALDNLGFGSA